MSARIDFYLLPEPGQDALWLFVCKLIEKAYHKGHRIFVFCEDKASAEHLDEYLWTFKSDSFIPHHLQGEGPTPPPPVQIAFENEPRGFNDLCINLTPEIPSFYNRFKRIIEIVSATESEREKSRQHYRQYKADGCIIHTHTIETQGS